MLIRTASLNDLEDISNLELKCFPASEAATKEEFKKRLTVYPNHFWLLFLDDDLVSFIDGFCTDIRDLTDDMFENADIHDENGDWQMIFGLNTHKDFRKRGFASMLIERLIEDAKADGRLGVVLTCKEPLIDFYSRFGFADEGISDSTHGGEVWNQMRLTF